MADDGLVFNDFGYDLGDPGPLTTTFYGHEVPVEYSRGLAAIKSELKGNPAALEAALVAYHKIIQ